MIARYIYLHEFGVLKLHKREKKKNGKETQNNDCEYIILSTTKSKLIYNIYDDTYICNISYSMVRDTVYLI